MKRYGDGIPNKVLREIFPKKHSRSPVSEHIYLHLKRMILSGQLGKGQSLLRWKCVLIFDVNEWDVSKAFSQLREDGLIIYKGRRSFVA